ncbi:hypothetical protein GCM10009678_84550 [Actinomadura kijaniata]
MAKVPVRTAYRSPDEADALLTDPRSTLRTPPVRLTSLLDRATGTPASTVVATCHGDADAAELRHLPAQEPARHGHPRESKAFAPSRRRRHRTPAPGRSAGPTGHPSTARRTGPPTPAPRPSGRWEAPPADRRWR